MSGNSTKRETRTRIVIHSIQKIANVHEFCWKPRVGSRCILQPMSWRGAGPTPPEGNVAHFSPASFRDARSEQLWVLPSCMQILSPSSLKTRNQKSETMVKHHQNMYITELSKVNSGKKFPECSQYFLGILHPWGSCPMSPLSNTGSCLLAGPMEVGVATRPKGKRSCK